VAACGADADHDRADRRGHTSAFLVDRRRRAERTDIGIDGVEREHTGIAQRQVAGWRLRNRSAVAGPDEDLAGGKRLVRLKQNRKRDCLNPAGRSPGVRT
jgi:hypothetical protein